MGIAQLDRQVLVTSGPARYLDAKKLSDLHDCQYLVLLGEPGLGKSIALNYLAAKYDTRALRAYRCEIRETGSDVPFFVDGLDEAPLDRAMNIAGGFYRAEGCKWRVSCRVEDWNSGGQLSEAFSRDHAAALDEPVVALLQPLDGVEAEAILHEMGHTSPGELLERLHTVGGTPFAMTPLGLRFLVDLPTDFQFDGRFDLYEQGVQRLAREENPAKQSGTEHPAVTEILEVAGKCFLTMLLCGRHGLRKVGRDEHSLSREDLGLRPAVFEAVLDTGLFLKDGDSFRAMHRSVQEFLAARFLAHAVRDGKVPFERALTLLVAGDGLPPDQNKSVFAWFAAHLEEAGHFYSSEKLVRLDPESLATHGDPGSLSTASRAYILRNMGERDPYFRSGVQESASSGTCLAGLVKPDVLSVAEEVLCAPSLNTHRVLTTLMAVAQGHPIQDMTTACLEVVHRPQVGVVCREHAVKAWAHCCGPSAAHVWDEIDRLIADDEIEWEERDRVVAELFCLLPPADLSTSDVIRVLDAFRRPVGASIASPLRHGLPNIYALRDIGWHIAASPIWRTLILENPKAWFVVHGTGSLEHRLAYVVCTAALVHNPDVGLCDFIHLMIATGAIVGADSASFGTLAMKWIGAREDHVEVAKALCMALDEEVAVRGMLSAGFRMVGLSVTPEFSRWLLTSEDIILTLGVTTVAKIAVDIARGVDESVPVWFNDLVKDLGERGAAPAARTAVDTLVQEQSTLRQAAALGSVDSMLSQNMQLWDGDLSAIAAGESEDPLHWGAVVYCGHQVLFEMPRGVFGEDLVRTVFGVELGTAILSGIVELLIKGHAPRVVAAAAASILLSKGEFTVLDGLEPQALLEIVVAVDEVRDASIRESLVGYVLGRLSALVVSDPAQLSVVVRAFVGQQRLLTALVRHSQRSSFHTWFLRLLLADPVSLTGSALSELIYIAEFNLPEAELLEAACTVLEKESFSDLQPDVLYVPGVHMHLNSMRKRDLLRWAVLGALRAPERFAKTLSEGVKVADMATVGLIVLEGFNQRELHLDAEKSVEGCRALLRVLMV